MAATSPSPAAAQFSTSLAPAASPSLGEASFEEDVGEEDVGIGLETSVPLHKETSSLNFGPCSLLQLRATVEKKLGLNLTSSEGQIALALSNMWQISACKQQLQQLRSIQDRVKAILQCILRDSTSTTTACLSSAWKPISSWEEYVDISPRANQILVQHLQGSQGKTLDETVVRMLNKTLTVGMQRVVNLSGRNMQERSGSDKTDKELAFAKKLLPTFQFAISRMYGEVNGPSELEVEKAVGRALRGSSDRDGGRQERRNRSANTDQVFRQAPKPAKPSKPSKPAKRRKVA